MEEQSEPPSKKQRVGDDETNPKPNQDSHGEGRDFTEDVDVTAAEDNFMVDEDKCTDFVTAEELEKLREFQVLDEVKSDDEDSVEEGSDSSDEVPEEEIEQMLEEGLPEYLKGGPKPKEKPYLIKQKVVLEEKGVNQFSVLPLDWVMVRHYSGMPVYVHRGTRVATLAKPYCLGKDNTRRHDIPISAIPCLAYRRALEEEAKQTEIDRQIEEQIKSGKWQKQSNKPTEKNTANKTTCPYLQAKGIAQESDEMPDNHDELKASVLKKDKISENAREQSNTEKGSEDVVEFGTDLVEKATDDVVETNKDFIETKTGKVEGPMIKDSKDSKEDVFKKPLVKTESSITLRINKYNIDKKDTDNNCSKFSNENKPTIVNTVINEQIEKLTEAIAEQESNLIENKTALIADAILNQIDNINENNSSQNISNDENVPMGTTEETALRICTKPDDYASKTTSQANVDKYNEKSNIEKGNNSNDMQNKDQRSNSERIVVSDKQNQNAENRNSTNEIQNQNDVLESIDSNTNELNTDKSKNKERGTASNVQNQNEAFKRIDSTNDELNIDKSTNVERLEVEHSNVHNQNEAFESRESTSDVRNQDGSLNIEKDSISDEKNQDGSSNVERNTASDVQNQDGGLNVEINTASDVQNQNGSSTVEDNDTTSDVPLNMQPVVLPGGIVMPPPRVESVSTSWKAQNLTHEQVNDYCKRLFKFRTIDVMYFKRWADRRKYMKARKALQYPPLPEGTKLITIPASATNNGGKAVKRECVMNMNGRSYLSVFHEYVRRALQKQPVYKFKQLENASTPYQAEVYIGGMAYGCGLGPSKRAAKCAAAKASIRILIPEMQLADEPATLADGAARTTEPDFSFFDNVGIEDPRISEFCAATCEPTPHAILRTCLLRNFGAMDKQIHTEIRKLEFQKVQLTMTVGKHSATVVCKNKKGAKQRASQAILQMLHPQLHSWGSLLRLYGSRSVKSCKEKKLEEQQITLLQDEARRNEPNYAVLEKLKHEMRKLRARDEAVVPIGTMLLKDDLPTHSNSNLNNVDL